MRRVVRWVGEWVVVARVVDGRSGDAAVLTGDETASCGRRGARGTEDGRESGVRETGDVGGRWQSV